MQGEAKYSYSSVTFLLIKSSHAQVASVGHVIAMSLGARDCVVLVLDDNGNAKYTRHFPGVQYNYTVLLCSVSGMYVI